MFIFYFPLQDGSNSVFNFDLSTFMLHRLLQPRNFVPRALLYNDGGFDVSPDGKTLCACAEYWLPEGVDNATDLLHPPERDDFYKNLDYESSSDESSSDEESDDDDDDKDVSDVTMEDASGDAVDKQGNSVDKSTDKVGQNSESSGIAAFTSSIK